MKFKIKTKVLEENLKNSLLFINKANKIPTLCNVLIKTDGNKIILTGTDLTTEGYIEINEEQKIYESGEVLTDTTKLLNILKLSEKEEITLETEGTSLIYSDETSMYELYTIETSNFSNFNTENESFEEIEIPSQNLFKALKETAFTAKNSAFKAYLTGISISTSNEDTLRFVSSDNFRLSCSDTNINNADLKLNRIIPKKTAYQILKFLEICKKNNPLVLKFSEKYLSLQIDNITINSKLIDDIFPDITPIMSRTYDKFLSVDKNKFFKSLKKASIFTEEEATPVIMNIEREEIVFYSEDSTSGRSKNILPVQYDFEPVRLSIKPSYLFDIESFIKSDKITFKFIDSKSPILVEDKENPNYKYLIQPTEG
jgi:DNA polymerase-3 subunit beta